VIGCCVHNDENIRDKMNAPLPLLKIAHGSAILGVASLFFLGWVTWIDSMTNGFWFPNFVLGLMEMFLGTVSLAYVGFRKLDTFVLNWLGFLDSWLGLFIFNLFWGLYWVASELDAWYIVPAVGCLIGATGCGLMFFLEKKESVWRHADANAAAPAAAAVAEAPAAEVQADAEQKEGDEAPKVPVADEEAPLEEAPLEEVVQVEAQPAAVEGDKPVDAADPAPKYEDQAEA
jgi:hypothetical protein